MALTVVLKPSGFQPVGGGSLIYQMTEASTTGKPNYRVQFQFNGYTATLPIFEFRLAGLTLNADIAPILRGLLLLSETPDLRFLNTYVKYQAVWDGGSDAQVNLSGDVIYFYIGNNNILNKRTDAQISDSFLIPTSVLYGWDNRSAYADFLASTGIYALSFMKAVGASGAVTTIQPFVGAVKKLVSFKFNPKKKTAVEVVEYTGSQVWSTSYANVVGLFGLQGVGQKFDTAALSGPGGVRVTIGKLGLPTNSLTFKIVGDSAGLPNEADVKATITLSDLTALTGGLEEVFLDFSAFSFLAATVYHFIILPVADGFSDGANTYYIYTSTASTFAGGNYVSKTAGVWSNDVNKDVRGELMTTGAGFNLFKSIPVKILPEIGNGIYLKWLNDLGGLSTWLFDYNQVLSLDPKRFGRYKTLQLFATGIPYDVWLMINELNKEGVDYGDNLKGGQYVKDFTDEANALPLFINPRSTVTETKRVLHNIELSARYQLAPNTLM